MIFRFDRFAQYGSIKGISGTPHTILVWGVALSGYQPAYRNGALGTVRT